MKVNLAKELNMEDFPTPLSLKKKEIAEAERKKDYSIACYINWHSDEVIERVMGELKDCAEKGYSEIRSNLLWFHYTQEYRDVVDYWNNPKFPQDVLILPWRKLMDKGWDVTYKIGKYPLGMQIYGWVYITPQEGKKPKFSFKMEFPKSLC